MQMSPNKNFSALADVVAPPGAAILPAAGAEFFYGIKNKLESTVR